MTWAYYPISTVLRTVVLHRTMIFALPAPSWMYLVCGMMSWQPRALHVLPRLSKLARCAGLTLLVASTAGPVPHVENLRTVATGICKALHQRRALNGQLTLP